MRVLWTKVGGLWPVDSGGRRRTFQILAELSRRHDVSVLTTHGPREEPAELRQHLPRCRHVWSVPYDVPKYGSRRFVGALARSWLSEYPVDLWKWRVPGLQAKLDELAASRAFDVVVADFLYAAVNVPPASRIPVAYFAHNVEHQIWKRLSDVERRWWRRAVLEVEWRKVRRCEARACAAARITVAVSPEDRDRLARESPGARVVSIPTGVDPAYFTPRPGVERPDHLVFSGSMDWYPNEDAVVHFADRILPAIRREIPGVTFSIVGRNPGARVRELARRPGIHVSGTVDDVRPLVAEGSLYVVPLRVGGGTRIKIFEALAMGRPVLSTTIGAEGLGTEPGRHLELADDEEAFARAAVALLRDPARRRALGCEGRRLVETRCAWTLVTDRFESHLQEVVAHHAGTPREATRRVPVS